MESSEIIKKVHCQCMMVVKFTNLARFCVYIYAQFFSIVNYRFKIKRMDYCPCCGKNQDEVKLLSLLDVFVSPDAVVQSI